jgi:DNA/RNA-binding domain of Phe-tRNA-synthetase-like protein
MTFVVAKECLRLGLRAGALVFRNVRVAPASPELRVETVREAQVIQDTFASRAEIRAAPEVRAFQELHQRVGVAAHKMQSSVERLLASARRRGDLPTINNLVDAYNLVSLRTRCSLGAHDLDAITSPVTLRLMTGAESFTPLGESRPVAVATGEYGYVDASERLLCQLDVRQANFSKVTEKTRNVLLIVEGTAAHEPEVLGRAFDEAAREVIRWCGGLAQIITLPVGDA